MTENPRHRVDWTIRMDPPNTAEAVEQLGRYFRATGERAYRHDLPPLTAADHTTALAYIGELRRNVDDERHRIITNALAGGLSWEQIARALRADVNLLRENYRARIDDELGP
ncbi:MULTISPECIES: hypothetical protein [Rhodococcus]|uniref:hypothetical protein n=1 Tax=Rhodococcus TaxID=1827 RepID=UPI00057524E7|nr:MULTISPECIES: hypothetical protein [Rhodococcus]KHJ74582.1 hypothetical protein QR64_00730 [Rhodococcus sp. Chr-9]WKK14790.1 hypothetical protein QYN14_26470 [Rhodococcus ruber]